MNQKTVIWVLVIAAVIVVIYAHRQNWLSFWPAASNITITSSVPLRNTPPGVTVVDKPVETSTQVIGYLPQ